MIPVIWEDDADFVWLKCHDKAAAINTEAEASDCSQEKSLEQSASIGESLLLMKFYSLSSGTAKQLLFAADGSEVNPMFEVNKEEDVIIRHPSSCFILGRSGTGKTTVIVMKLLRCELEYRSTERLSGLRQIIVTLSPYLCAAIKRHIDQSLR
jgi:hypothetical protein